MQPIYIYIYIYIYILVQFPLFYSLCSILNLIAIMHTAKTTFTVRVGHYTLLEK